MLQLATLGGETMGTTWSVKLAAPSRIDLHALHHGIQQQLDAVVRQMSTWEPGSDISRYNRAAANTRHVVPAAFFRVLSCAVEIAKDSAGAFDPTVGTLVGLWGFGADAQDRRSAPDEATLRDAHRHIGWQRLELHAETRELLQPGGVHLDLSAIAKGFGVDLVATHLRAQGIGSALIEVGGEVFGYGAKPDGAPWRVLVEAAEEERDGEPRVLTLDGLAVATSGDRWHHRDIRNAAGASVRLSHSLDPRSGRPVADAAASVTVIADDAMHADAWATALTVMGDADGFAFAQRNALAARFVRRNAHGLSERMTDAFQAHLAT